MLKASIKSLFAHKARLALTLLAIVLGVAFVTGTFIYTDTTNDAFDGIFDEAFEGIDIAIAGESEFTFGEGVFFDESLVDDVAAVEGVATATPSLTAFGIKIIDKEGDPLGGGGPPQFGGYLPEDLSATGGFTLREGSPPLDSSQLVIDAASAEEAGYVVGDTVAVEFPATGAKEFTLVGIAGFGDLANIGGATFALFDLDTIQENAGKEGQVGEIYVNALGGTDVDTLVTDIQSILPDNATAQSAQDAAEAQAADVQAGLSFFGTFLLVFAFIALFVATFLIYNTFRIVVAQRLRELALLRAIGATRSQVLRTVLFEAVVIGVVGAIVGIIGGLGLAIALRFGLEQFGVDLPGGSLVLAPRTIIVGLTVGIVVTIVSAIVPAIGASRIAPVAAMRSDSIAPRRKTLRMRAIVGIVVTAAGIALMFSGLRGDFDGATVPLTLIGAGAAIIILGTYVLSALIAEPVARFIGAPFAKLFGVSGTLAQRNAGRSPRRTSATAAAIMVGIALIAMVSLLNASIRGTIDDIFANGVNADVLIQPSDQFSLTGFSADLADQAETLPEVAGVTRSQQGSMIVDDGETFVASIEENAVDFFVVDEIEGVSYPSPTGLLIDRNSADENNWTIGTTIDVRFEQTGDTQLTVEGIVTGDAYNGLSMSREGYAMHFPSSGDSSVFVKSADGFSPEETRDAIQAVAADVPTAKVQTNEEAIDEIGQQLNQTLGLITGLLAMTVLIALIGVTNTMALAVIERTREIGLLRAVGLNRKQTRRMIRSEASIVSAFGALLGIGLGVFFGWAVLQPLKEEGFSAFVVPYSTLAIWVVVTGILGVVFAMWPAWRASKLNVLDAISYE